MISYSPEEPTAFIYFALHLPRFWMLVSVCLCLGDGGGVRVICRYTQVMTLRRLACNSRPSIPSLGPNITTRVSCNFQSLARSRELQGTILWYTIEIKAHRYDSAILWYYEPSQNTTNPLKMTYSIY